VTAIFRRGRIFAALIMLGIVLGYGVYVAYGQIFVNDHARAIEPLQIKNVLDSDEVVKLNLVANGGEPIEGLDGKKYAFLTIKNLNSDDPHDMKKFHFDRQEPESGLWLSDKSGKEKVFCSRVEVEYLPVLMRGGPEQLNSAPIPKRWTYLFGKKQFEVRGIEYNQDVAVIASIETGDGKKASTPILGLRLRPLSFSGYPIVTPYKLDSAEYKKSQADELGVWLGLALFMVVPCTFLPFCILLGELFYFFCKSAQKK